MSFRIRLSLVLALSAALPGMVDRPDAVSVGEVLSQIRSQGVIALTAVEWHEECPAFRVRSRGGHQIEIPFAAAERAMNFSCTKGDGRLAAGDGAAAYDWSQFEPVYSGRSVLLPLEEVSGSAAGCARLQAEAIEKSSMDPAFHQALGSRDVTAKEIRLLVVGARHVGLSRSVAPSPRASVEDRDGQRVAVFQAVWTEASRRCHLMQEHELTAVLRAAPESEAFSQRELASSSGGRVAGP